MKDEHKAQLDIVFSQAQERRNREEAERQAAEDKDRQFDALFTRLGEEIVLPTFATMTDYLTGKGIKAEVEVYGARPWDKDDVPTEYFYALVLRDPAARREPRDRRIKVIGDPRERTIRLETAVSDSPGGAQPEKLDRTQGIAGITEERLYAVLQDVLRMHLA